MADQRDDRLGSSGVFKAIMKSARKFKRAVTGGDDELAPIVQELGAKIGQAFVAGRFADVYALATAHLQQHTAKPQFESRWRDAVRHRMPLTSFEIANVGEIEIGFIPGLEDTPQSQFVAFLEIAFSNPDVALDHEKAFVVAAVLLDQDGEVRIGAIHTR